MNKVLVPNQHVFVRPSLSIFEVIFAVSFDKFGGKWIRIEAEENAA